jgi:hypothetical protein
MFTRIDDFITGIFVYLRIKRDDILFSLLGPFKKFLVADVISFFGLILSFFAAYFLSKSILLFNIFWIGKKIADIVDGSVARMNNIHWIKKINVDSWCDILSSLILFIGTIPVVGVVFSMIVLVLHLIHVFFDSRLMGKGKLSAPSNPSYFFFFFGLIRTGMYFQIIYTIIAVLINRFWLTKRES